MAGHEEFLAWTRPNTPRQTDERRATLVVERQLTLSPLAAERQNRYVSTDSTDRWQETMRHKPSSLSASLSDSLTDTDLHSVAVEMTESLAEVLLEEGVAKNIPIVSAIYDLAKLGVHVRDRLFLKKLLYFLSELASVPVEERAAMVRRVDQSGKHRTKVGEKLLYILDKSDDHENAQTVARLFKAFLTGELSYDEFLRGCRAIQQVIPDDLWSFVDFQDPSFPLSILGFRAGSTSRN